MVGSDLKVAAVELGRLRWQRRRLMKPWMGHLLVLVDGKTNLLWMVVGQLGGDPG